MNLENRREPAPIEVDHCVADIIVVDEGDSPQRPHVTLALDVYTRIPVAIYMSFGDKPDLRSILGPQP